MAADFQKVALIAGGGDLPCELAATCAANEISFYVIRLTGYADEKLAAYDGEDRRLGEFGGILKAMRTQGCDAVIFAGLVQRPDFAAIRPDWRGATLLPRIIAAARDGDGAMLDALVAAFGDEGFKVLGADDLAAPLVTDAGLVAGDPPTDEDWRDIVKAASVIDALGPFDVGQGTVVRDGFVVAIEAAEGTDLMLERTATITARLDDRCAGILLKRPKPEQERRVDLPTIGVRTVERAAAARLRGIAIEAGGSLILNRAAVEEAATAHGLFVLAFEPQDLEARR